MPPKSRSSAKKSKASAKKSSSIPDVFVDMLAEAADASPSQFDDQGRTVKRRRTGGRRSGESIRGSNGVKAEADEESLTEATRAESGEDTLSAKSIPAPRDPRSEAAPLDPSPMSSDESEVAWEDVAINEEESYSESSSEAESIELDLNEAQRKSNRKRVSEVKRKALSKAEKALRIDVHKMHIMCLLAHLQLRNDWCGEKGTKKRLKQILSKRTISYLNPDPALSQFQQVRSFTDGLSQVSELWRATFIIIARGSKAAVWAEKPDDLKNYKLPEDTDDPLTDIEDFHELASGQSGSRDIGAQLFCALLRSAGVDTRLICSLQVLPFSNPSGKPPVLARSWKKQVVCADPEPDLKAADAANLSSEADESNKPLVPKYAKRLGLPSLKDDEVADTGKAVTPKGPAKRKFRESRYPVYWVEAFNKASQKWMPVDPLVTQSIGKPGQFEPPISESENSMYYVMAFDDDGYVRDVTRRYAKAFNAKTRRHRVESTKDGDRWFKKVMRQLKRPWKLDRDQIEDVELASAEAREPMPKNVLDYKDHPYYALERHLRRSEVLHPKTKIGQCVSGKSVESVYRRNCVHTVRSADRWYRLGRDIKPGEQPLKFNRSRRRRSLSPAEDSVGEDQDGIGMYAEFQTAMYIPPPIVHGFVPKNAYGNLDIYVPSMIPSGGIHIAHPAARQAARILGIDFAAAITGFEFRGRNATAIEKGVVVANDYREAMVETLNSMHQETLQERQAKQSLEALARWKRFLIALRIRERVMGYEIEGEEAEKQQKKAEMDNMDLDDNGDDGGGGFMPDPDASSAEQPGHEAKEAVSLPPSAFNSHFTPRSSNSKHDDQLHIDIIEPPPPPVAPQEALLSKSMPAKPQSEKPVKPPSSLGLGFGKAVLASIHNSGEQVPAAREQGTVVERPLLPRPPPEPAVQQQQTPNVTANDGGGFIPADNAEVSRQIKNSTSEQEVAEEPQEMALDTLFEGKNRAKDDDNKSVSSDSLSQGSLLSHDPEDDDAEVDWL